MRPDPKPEKKPKKAPKPLKRTAIKKKAKVTGEGSVFEDVLNEIPYTGPTRCYVCDKKISVITHHNFSHILPKKKYPEYRLYAPNIKIMCFNFIAVDGDQGCHYNWDFKPRSELKDEKWEKVFELEETLKQQYPEII